jgi:hypothetical protein
MINTQNTVEEGSANINAETKNLLKAHLPLIKADKVFMSALYAVVYICNNLTKFSKNSP